MAKALGHPVRAGIVRMLAAQETCQYGDLSDRLPLAKSTVSQHLKILREAGSGAGGDGRYAGVLLHRSGGSGALKCSGGGALR
jgi:predicted ArsR family transcriptional regulator